MPLRIGFDMDGTIADFASAFHDVDVRLFGSGAFLRAGEPEEGAQIDDPGLLAPDPQLPEGDQEGTGQRELNAREARRRRDAVWRAIASTPNFWETVRPIEDGAVRRIHRLMIEHQWEVFFITQRPKTDGDTVQRQTQRWLVEQGFDLPSVLVVGGSRGAAAGALRLAYHVDDSARNCLDVKAQSGARPILIVGDQDATTIESARKLGIGTARSIGDALDILAEASTNRAHPGLLARLAEMVGWK